MGIFSFLTAFCGCKDTPEFKSVEADEFENIISNPSVVLLDVRTADEFAESHIENAVNINVAQVNFSDEALNKLPKNKTIAVYCRSGRRSKMAANELTKLGFQVVELDKGFHSWIDSNKQVVNGTEEE